MGWSIFPRKQINIQWPRSDANGVYSFTDAELSFLREFRYAELAIDRVSLTIRPRLWPRLASRWDVFCDDRFPKVLENTCQIFISFPLRSPGFMTVNYVRAGKAIEYAVILKAVKMLDQIASGRDCHAIVCQVISPRISERVLRRWGYVPHARSVGFGHFIKRL